MFEKTLTYTSLKVLYLILAFVELSRLRRNNKNMFYLIVQTRPCGEELQMLQAKMLTPSAS